MSPDSSLAHYRVLDLTTEKGFVCGKILGDLGADVIKVEPRGGDPARKVGPFYRTPGQPGHSLYWWAFNTSKRGITLDIGTPEGKKVLKRLALDADIAIESFSPGHLDSLGLGYSALSQLNPGLIFVSITPFGQTGPYRDFKITDLTAMALGGQMYIAGDPDRPPLRIGVPQADILAGAHAAVGCMLALQHRHRSGQGQYIDVSMHESVIHILSSELPFWEYSRVVFPRTGPRRPLGRLLGRQVWPCKDGFVTFRILGGTFTRQIKYLVDWMDEKGMAGPLKEVRWESLDMVSVSQEQMDSWERAIIHFFTQHTKAELYHGAAQRHIALAPSYDFRELLQDEHLLSRKFWVTVPHSDIHTEVTYPGAPYILSRTPWRISCRAPVLGEHNDEVLAEVMSPVNTARPFRTKSSNSTNHGDSINPDGSGHAAGNNSPLPLTGILVADFSKVYSGPLVTKYLADFGATVVKIESRTSLDMSRVTPPFRGGKPDVDGTGAFIVANSSKYSLGINMGDPRGIEVARRLIARADVLAENFAPGVMEKWGLDYPAVQKIKPDIIMFRHSIMGQTGTLCHHPGWGWNVNGLAGFNHVTGWPDREATGPNVPYPDFVAPWYGAVAILAALDHRQRTGQGQCIDQSQLEVGITCQATAILDFTLNGHDPTRQGNRSESAAPHGAFPCKGKDRWCAIAVSGGPVWGAFCRAVDSPSWTADTRFSTLAGRKANEDELEKLVAAWTLDYSAEDIMARLQAGGVPAGVVQTNQDIIEKDPQLKHRQHFVPLEHPRIGIALHQNWPIRLSLTPARVTRAPLLAEHTRSVCTEILGMSDTEFQGLVEAGILEIPRETAPANPVQPRKTVQP